MTAYEWAHQPEITAMLPYLYIQQGADSDLNGPRHRVEVRSWVPKAVRELRVKCCKCGITMHPIRTRDGWATAYFSVCGRLETCKPCPRGQMATDTIEAVRERIRNEGGIAAERLF